ncbi:hypothetical protein LPJ78_004883 [Coemansia sp. RSA 989]|nr:hypothetical protein LPJ68_004553 [Coemansia sp. RSA 1086]KAJ1747969.1 hypothetical protein LPJ79_004887 [Coemansia sp. RSA 1821]KAJ1862180.1 hypothetical protein LPJ78_004883 [Coemansia sp. RSA 989]KAJ2631990.1 hypothetical protein H4R22_001590 [Coemansia sp. RSA 1290]KAJ2646193.1 hypothetical protein IWW40_005592 [Coemansia sp. RSA 1250]KAJ2668075.1 hypothetical protein IWW42_005479 [Coemansia sp. RSA 1085]
MQADNRGEKAEVQRVMWSPYPDHQLTIWATAPQPAPLSHLDSPASMRSKQRRQLQSWQISRSFASAKGRTTEILASHRLNFGNQCIQSLNIPRSALPFLNTLVELRMPRNKLHTLPCTLFDLQGLEILNLENNCLDEHCAEDAWWRKLTRLRVLFLADNRFTQLPPSLGRMPRLFYIDVSDNSQLSSLPAELVQSPSVGTLAASRCSMALASMMEPGKSIPFIDRLAPHIKPAHVPPLAALCLRAVGRAMAQTYEEGHVYYESDLCERLIAACEMVKRYPEQYQVLDLLLDALGDTKSQSACSVCGGVVLMSAFSFVRQEEGWELPVAWRCCSAKCRDLCVIEKREL